MHPETGEDDWDFGMKAWQQGQSGEIVENWDDIKLKTMLLINLAKFNQNQGMCQDLKETEGHQISARPSTWEWRKWNTLIMEYIRRSISARINLEKMSKVIEGYENEQIEQLLEEK